MAGETQLHKTLKKEACRWLLRAGYRCIAAEVRLTPLGIVDAVGTGVFRPYHNYLELGREVTQVCFIECKATRSDFLRLRRRRATEPFADGTAKQREEKTSRPAAVATDAGAGEV